MRQHLPAFTHSYIRCAKRAYGRVELGVVDRRSRLAYNRATTGKDGPEEIIPLPLFEVWIPNFHLQRYELHMPQKLYESPKYAMHRNPVTLVEP